MESPVSICHQPLGRTSLRVPAIVFGTSCLGNLYEVMPDATKLATIREMFRQTPAPVALDSAGKYGAGLALEVIGNALRQLNVLPEDALISNKLGWYRVPLRGPEPTFERGVWAGIQHDAESRISYEGMYQCYEQGCELLGAPYRPAMVSVHDPDEFLAAGGRLESVLGAYRALFELKAQGRVQAVGVGAKDWRVIRTIAEAVNLDWVMLACSLTPYTHPPELLAFCAQLHARGVGIINSAVFNAGFLTGGDWFDYRKPDPAKDAALFRWRERFLAICRDYAVTPAKACVQFGFAVPGVVAVALNTSKPERIRENAASVTARIPPAFWRHLQAEGLIGRTVSSWGE
ncbi:MAG: aldo/keto reductase [Lentisphaerae bacterium]|nr:aldo/keto reductase [Lentisphaerota bacterium]